MITTVKFPDLMQIGLIMQIQYESKSLRAKLIAQDY